MQDLINHCIQISQKKNTVEFKLIGIPGSISNNGGNRSACPDQKILAHIEKYLIKPISQLILAYDPLNSDKRPSVKLVFDPSCEPLQNEEKSEIKADFVLESPQISLDRVALPQNTISQLYAVLKLISHHTLIYETWNLKSVLYTGSAITLNFWGPPGTGKTFCAEAIAGTLGKKFIRTDYSQLESKYVGDTSKNITQLFRYASEHDAVLFFDEADSLLGKRLSHVTQSADHGVNMSRSVMLIELERYNGIVIFATNFIRNYDIAFAGRLLHQVEFTIPDQATRAAIFQLHLPKELPLEDDVTVEWLASQSDSFSGREIRNVVLKMAAKCALENEKCILQRHALQAIEEIRRVQKEISSQNAQEWIEKKLKAQ